MSEQAADSHAMETDTIDVTRAESEPVNVLVAAVELKLDELETTIAEATVGDWTLRLVRAEEGQPPLYLQRYEVNNEEVLNINTYDVPRARWWSQSWERPQARSIPLHLNKRVDKGWRPQRAMFVSQYDTPPYPSEGYMLGYLTSLTWLPVKDTARQSQKEANKT